MNQITTDLERNLLGLLFLPRYRDMTLDQIRLLASGYVMPETLKLWASFEIAEQDETPADGR